jgi:hypothetical protein
MKSLGIVFSLFLLGACAADESSSTTVSASAPAQDARASAAPATEASSGSGEAGSLGREAPNQSSTPSRPLGDKSERPVNDLTRSVEYYDGDERRTLWISDELIAEVAPTEAGRAAVLELDADAEERPTRQQGMRLWRMRPAQGAEAAAKHMSREKLRFSPVLHDSASSTSPLAALPGGVVATFPVSWQRARIDTWLAARQLRIAEEVVADANMFLVETPPGLEAVTIANQLHETGELVSCTPNLWREAATR